MSWIDDLNNSTRPDGKITPFQPQQSKPSAGGLKSFAAGLLPTIGGALGAVGGSFIAPIAGTAAGGAAGSAIGEALKERITGQKLNAKDIAIQGGLGALPGVFKGAKAGVTALKAGKDLQEAGGAAQTASQAAGQTTPSLFGKLSTNLTKSGSGLKINGAVGDINKTDQAAQTLQRLGIKGTPNTQLKKIADTMSSHGAKVDAILSKNPISVDGSQVKAQVAQAIDDPTKFAELDLSTPGAQRALNAHLDKFAGATNAKEVNDYIKVLNPIATKAQDALVRGATLTDKQTAALAAKKAGDEVLSQFPEIKPLKQDMATLFERNPQIAAQAGKSADIPILGALGIKSKAAASVGNSIKSTAGQALAGVDNAVKSPTGQATKTVGKSLLSQITTRAAASPFTSTPQSDTSTANPSSSSQLTTPPAQNQNSAQDTNGNGIDYELEGQKALAAGDYRAFSAIMQLAALADKKATNSASSLTTNQKNEVVGQQKAIDALKTYTDRLTAAGGGSGPILGAVQGSVLGNYISPNARALDSQRIDIASAIAGSLNPRGTVSPVTARLIADALPSVRDTKDVAQAKINGLIQQIQSGAFSAATPVGTLANGLNDTTQ